MIKKRIMTLMAVLALAVGLMLGACGETKSATGGSGSAGTGSKPVATAPATKDGKYIGEKAAIDIALKHAGLKEKEVTKLKAKLVFGIVCRMPVTGICHAEGDGCRQ